MLRNFFAVVVGVVTAGVIIFAMEILNGKIYPLPEYLLPPNIPNTDAFKEYIQTAPTGMFLLLILGYAVGSFFGGISSSAISKQNKIRKAITTGGILTGLGVFNLIMIPHPLWVAICVVLVYIPFAYLGGMLGKKITEKTD